jgi:hypothetical protein
MIGPLIDFGGWLYGYCTDFCINLANLLGVSYYEVNTLMFCVIFPVATAGLLALYLVQRVRLAIALKRAVQPPPTRGR